MTDPKALTIAQELAAVQAWWRDAGVDQAFDEATTNWLSEPEAAVEEGIAPSIFTPPAATARKVEPPPQQMNMGGDKANWPSDLTAFQSWWLSQPSLDSGGSFPRVAPKGERGAKLMIIVAEPEEQDHERLLSGPLGQFLANILLAIGYDSHDPEQIYLAAALPRHLPMADWAQLQATGLGDLIHHHINLAAPDKICVFGRNLWPLLGHDLAQPTASLPEINHDGRTIPLLGAEGLSVLLRSAPRRRRFWHRWLEWSARSMDN